MNGFMLDTNMVSHIVKGHEPVVDRATSVRVTSLAISAITESELLFGLVKRPEARALHDVVNQFLRRVQVLPWDRAAARRYGRLRASLQKRGRNLSPLDLLIASHALEMKMTMVAGDSAFTQVPGLKVENWTQSRV